MKKLLSILLALTLCVSLLPLGALASEEPVEETEAPAEETEIPAEETTAPVETEEPAGVPVETPIEPEEPAEESPIEEMEEIVEAEASGAADDPANEEAAAMDIVASGTCGADGGNLTWTLDSDGTLAISGAGDMEDYNNSDAPWKSYTVTATVIESGVTSIGYGAFEGCYSLANVTIPSSVTSIGWWAFANCGSLANVTIPDGVTSIEAQAFCYCRSLTSVTIPNSVTYIEYRAFYCTSLTSVTIGNGVACIEDGAFGSCDNLISITVDERNLNYCSEDGVLYNKNKTELIQYPAGKSDTEFSIPAGVTSIGSHAFCGCDNLTSVTIPDSVTSIGEWAFEGCHSLTSVTIPDSVTSIENEVFCRCTSLMSVTIPDSVTSIGWYIFWDCVSLTSVTIGNSVTSIGYYAFEGCDSLTSVTFSGDAPEIDSDAFSGVTATAYYYSDATGWTDAVRSGYGGTLTWVCVAADRRTGITVAGEGWDGGITLTAEKVTLDAKPAWPETAAILKYTPYDISLTKTETGDFQPGNATVSIPVPLGYNGTKCGVYYIDNGTAADMNAQYDADSGALTFTTTHFSTYAVAQKKADGARLLGDANGDGGVDLLDAMSVAQYAVALIDPAGEGDEGFVTAADVSGDKAVSAADAMLLAYYEVKAITTFPAEN